MKDCSFVTVNFLCTDSIEANPIKVFQLLRYGVKLLLPFRIYCIL